MLEVRMEGKVVVIDVRKRALRGEHPGNEVMDYIKKSPVDMIFEIHVPHEAKPLVKKLEEEIGMVVQPNKVEEGHYYLVASHSKRYNR